MQKEDINKYEYEELFEVIVANNNLMKYERCCCFKRNIGSNKRGPMELVRINIY